MTRETKIGLLVGLAFIIVIGILLSDQLMRSTEPPAAPLSSAADTVRRATATPASNNPVLQKVQTPGNVSPENQVPTRDEVVARPPPVTFVEIKPSGAVDGVNGQNNGVNNVNPGVIVPRVNNPANSGMVYNGGNANGAGNGLVNNGSRSLEDIANQHGEPLVGLDGRGVRNNTAGGNGNVGNGVGGNGTAGNGTGGNVAGNFKDVKAEAGDSLSKMASKHMGSSSKANQEAIMRANPQMQNNPAKIFSGQTYKIPMVAVNTTAGGNGVANNSNANTNVPNANTGSTGNGAGNTNGAGHANNVAGNSAGGNANNTNRPASAEYFYTVKKGDSLWRIANDQCGDAGLVAAIKELNKDALKGGETVQENMKLRLPAKPIASAH